jgi:undecaprenyl-diphosphatase
MKPGSRLPFSPPELWRRARGLGWPGFVLLLAFLTLCLAVWGFVAVAEEVLEGEHQPLEDRLLLMLRRPDDLRQPIGPPWLETVALDLTSLGGGPVLTLLTALVLGFLLVRRQYGPALLVFLATTIGSGLGHLLKLAFDRPRPSVVPHLSEVLNASFPSGHSMSSSIVYLTLGVLLAQTLARRREKIYIIATALLLSFVVGLTRVYLGVHYPTDVVAGWCAGTAWALVCWLVTCWLQSRGKMRGPREEEEENAAAEVPPPVAAGTAAIPAAAPAPRPPGTAKEPPAGAPPNPY